VGPSKKSDEYLRKAGVRKQVEIVPNGVDINRFCQDNVSEQTRQALKERYNIKPDAYVGCLITRIGREKSIDVLLEYTAKYMEKNERYHLLIVGDGPTKKSLENQARILGIEDRVTFTGKVLNKDILPYYGISDIFITASLSEINSISMLEAMSMGLPVLQRYDEVNKDQVIDGVNGYTFVDAETMREKIDYLMKMEKADIDKLKERVRESVMKRGSQDVAKILVEIYRRAYMQKEAKKVKKGI
jgi:1,2-diacylglycerol 3-alpha-glucosyltransferase